MERKKKILVLTSRFPYPPVGGDRLRVFYLIRLLSEHYNVDVLSLNEEPVRREDHDAMKHFVRDVRCFTYSPLTYRIHAFIYALVTRGPLQVGYYWFRSVQRYIDSVVNNYDLVFCFHIRTTEYVKNLPVKKVVDLVDAISMNYQRALTMDIGFLWKMIYRYEQRRIEKYEVEIANCFDRSFIISTVDKDYLSHRGANSNSMVVIPNGTEAHYQPGNLDHPTEDIDFTFLGNMESQANRSAAIFFAKNILPIITKGSLSKVNYYIVGKNPSPEVLSLHDGSRIFVTGTVASTAEYISRTKVMVAPMLFGAGVQNKILESMAMQKPMITTTIGAEGINGTEGVHYCIADTPEQFAATALRLLNDGNARTVIGANAGEFARKHFQWKNVGESLSKEIDSLFSDEKQNT